jgi:hypothetical protein
MKVLQDPKAQGVNLDPLDAMEWPAFRASWAGPGIKGIKVKRHLVLFISTPSLLNDKILLKC